MLKLYMDTSFTLTIIASLAAIFILVPVLLIQYFIHKKIFDTTYFNVKYFSEGELVVFSSGFIFYLVKTLAYVRAIALPKTMRIRFKEDILTYKDHPIVYLLACFTMLLIMLGIIILVNLIIFAGFWSYYK